MPPGKLGVLGESASQCRNLVVPSSLHARMLICVYGSDLTGSRTEPLDKHMCCRYRKETCGLVSVSEITVRGAADVAGRVPRDTYMSALQENLPKGAEATVTSYPMSLESDFTLPAGTKVPEGKSSLQTSARLVQHSK